ncbi:MAG: hypothetical protein HS126_17690 [Anaerolineales bacterium]|nr:hypothetical protein [Anaerolineales bacterium]
MKIITITFGVLLTLLGVGSYVGTGTSSLTALIPAVLGLAIAGLGFMSHPERGSKNTPFFGAVFLAILTLLGSLRGVINFFTMLSGGEVARPAATTAQALMAALCLVFVVLAVTLTPNFWQGWKVFGHFLGNLLARVVLTIFYFTVFVPFAVGVRLFSDPLYLKTMPAKLWHSRHTGDQTLEDVLRQY